MRHVCCRLVGLYWPDFRCCPGLAATNGSVLEGTMLLFIYAMGLGLLLILIATLFGRLPRDHAIWRFHAVAADR